MTKLTRHILALAVMIAVATLPRRLRERYREEWLADLEGATVNGVRPAGVALGALLFSATLGRSAPEISGMPLAVVVRRRARWGVAFIASAAILALGYYLVGGYRGGGALTEVVVAVGGFVVLAVASAFLLLGLVQTWRAAASASVLSIVAAGLFTAGIVGCAAGMIIPSLRMFAIVGLMLAFGGGICGAVAWSSAPPVLAPIARPFATWHPARLVTISTVLLTALIVFGAVELLVWGPLAQTEGYTLIEIYDGLSTVDRRYGVILILIWIVFWMLAVAAFAIVLPRVVQSAGITVRTAVASACALATVIVFFHFWAGFSLGMSIADTLSPNTGAMSPFGHLYAIIGQLALVAALFLGIAPRRMQRAESATTAA